MVLRKYFNMRRELIFGFIVILCGVRLNVRGAVLNPVDVTTEATFQDVRNKWDALDKNIRNGMNNVLQQVLPILVRTSSEIEISADCTTTLLKLMLSLRQLKAWPILMLDASGKVGSGIFSGTPTELGNYDQCINITDYNEYTNELNFRGQYCTVNFRSPIPKRPRFVRINEIVPPLDNYTSDNFVIQEFQKIVQYAYFLSYRMGVCVPSTCTIDDVRRIAAHMSSQFGMYSDVPRCEVKEPLKFDKTQIFMLVVVGIFVLLCTVGTAIDVAYSYLNEGKTNEQSESMWRKLITSFSVEKNIQKLLHVDDNSNSISCLHGLRFISVVWVILGHTYLFMDFQTLRSLILLRDWVRDFAFQAIINGLVAVDTFFFISGLLVSYLTVKYFDTRGQRGFNIPIMIARRIWRLLPSNMMIIGFTILIPLINSGPVWHESVDPLSDNCRRNWWTNALFINNFVGSSHVCLPHAWYTAADTQMFFLAIIYFVLYFKKPVIGIAYNVFLIVFSAVSTAIINYWRKLPPTMLIANPVPADMIELWNWTHVKPHVHLGAYCIGVSLGTYLARHKKTVMKPLIVVLGWCAAFTCNMSIMYSTYEWNRDTTPGVAISTFYAGIHRIAWALGLAWVVFACVNGYGGFVNRFLSWKGMILFSRLTFMAYLWHFLIIIIYVGSIKTGIDSYHMFFIWVFFGNLIVSFCLAFMSHVLYEGPLSLIERAVLGRIFNREKASKQTNGVSTNGSAKLETVMTEKHPRPVRETEGHYVMRM